jgi:hypothetical protein
MTFKTPSPAVYLGSLLIAAPIAYLLFWVLQMQNQTSNSLVVLAAGLFIGHLVGVFSQPSSARPKTNTSAPTADAAPSGDTISLYVGNLAYRAQRSELHELFSQYGAVDSVRIMTDRATRRPRGYAFVEMDAKGARKAIEQLDNTDFCERNLRVSEAKERQ